MPLYRCNRILAPWRMENTTLNELNLFYSYNSINVTISNFDEVEEPRIWLVQKYKRLHILGFYRLWCPVNSIPVMLKSIIWALCDDMSMVYKAMGVEEKDMQNI